MRLAGLLLVFLPGPALAHKLTVTVTPVGDRLRVVAAYDGGDPADGATTVVRDAAGTEFSRTTLDAGGAGDLPRPPGEWAVTVDDGAGHRTSVRSDRREVGASRWLTLAVGLSLVGGWAWWRMRSRR